jgi:MFS family permease
VTRRGFLDSPRGRPFRALRHPSFRLYFASFLISQAGFWLNHVSLQGLLAELTDGRPDAMGRYYFTVFIPGFVLAPLAGVLADRIDRKRIALSCAAAVIGLATALAGLSAAGLLTPARVLLFGLLLGTAYTFSTPANHAIVANAVPREDLGSAISLQAALNNLTRVGGPLLAAPLLAARHFEASFALYAGASLVAALLLALVRIRPYAPERDAGGILGRVRDGLVHARERRPALPALALVAALSLFGVSHVALLPTFAREVLGRMELFPWLVATTGLGAVFGALVTGYRIPSLRTAALQLALYGLALAWFSSTRSVALALGAQLLVGYFYFCVMTGLQTLIQGVVAESRRGRVMSLFHVAWGGLVPFGGLAMGELAVRAGSAATIAIGATACVACGGLLALRAPHFTREGPSA